MAFEAARAWSSGSGRAAMSCSVLTSTLIIPCRLSAHECSSPVKKAVGGHAHTATHSAAQRMTGILTSGRSWAARISSPSYCQPPHLVPRKIGRHCR
jgi:hypothetical protein